MGNSRKYPGMILTVKEIRFAKLIIFFWSKILTFRWFGYMFSPKEHENVNSYCAILNKFGGEQPKVIGEILHC